MEGNSRLSQIGNYFRFGNTRSRIGNNCRFDLLYYVCMISLTVLAIALFLLFVHNKGTERDEKEAAEGRIATLESEMSALTEENGRLESDNRFLLDRHSMAMARLAEFGIPLESPSASTAGITGTDTLSVMPGMEHLGDDWTVTYYLANTATTGETMANGQKVFEGAVATDESIPFGTELCLVYGGQTHWFVVCDRGVSGKVVDVYVDSPDKIPAHGVERGVSVYRKEEGK